MNTSRKLLLAVAAACLAMLGLALYLQHGMGLLPCPLCVIQRYLFLAIAIACLLGAGGGTLLFGAGVALLAALGGIGVAGKHLYVLAHPGLSCGIDPMQTALNRIYSAQLLPFLFHAEGLCEDALAPFFGLSIPQWSLLGFALCAGALIWAIWRRP